MKVKYKFHLVRDIRNILKNRVVAFLIVKWMGHMVQ